MYAESTVQLLLLLFLLSGEAQISDLFPKENKNPNIAVTGVVHNREGPYVHTFTFPPRSLTIPLLNKSSLPEIFIKSSLL